MTAQMRQTSGAGEARLPLPRGWWAESAEVYYTDAPVVVAAGENIETLKMIARGNPRLRSRLCTHPHPSAQLHEMLIVHHRDVYVRPHMHLGKPESFHLLEGEVLVVMFNEDGSIANVLDAGQYETGKPFYYRMSEKMFHTLLITSDWLVFHEATMGPFNSAQTKFAEWAPDGSDPGAAHRFNDELRRKADAFLAARLRSNLL